MPGGAVDLEEIVDDGPAQVEIAQQHRTLRQVGFRQRQVDGGESLALGRRRAGDDGGVQRLQRLQVVQARAQRAKLFGGSFVRIVEVQQVGFGRRVELHHLHVASMPG